MRYRIALLLALLLGAHVSVSQACSVCLCGDNLFCFNQQNTTLPVMFQHGGLRLNLQTLYTSKSNALSPDEGPGTESDREYRPSVKATYGITDWLSGSVQLPLSAKRLETVGPNIIDRSTSTGLGDAEISAVWTRRLKESMDQSVQIGLAGALKLPTGRNNIQREGQRLDEHMQSGTGSYDWQGGVAIGRSGRAFALSGSLYYRLNGTNNNSYHYGDAFLFNAGIQRRISSLFTVSGQLNGRSAKRDTQDAITVDNTGGTVLYIAPALNIVLQRSVDLLLNLQLPVSQHLYGTQTEKPVLTAGLNVDVF